MIPCGTSPSVQASDLYLNLWNRTDDEAVSLTGDHEVLDTWHRTFRARFYQQD